MEKRDGKVDTNALELQETVESNLINNLSKMISDNRVSEYSNYNLRMILKNARELKERYKDSRNVKLLSLIDTWESLLVKEKESREPKLNGISKQTFRGRLRSGWSLDKALNTPVKNTSAYANLLRKNGYMPVLVDHLGNEFSSIVKMAEYWDVSVLKLKEAIKNNKDLDLGKFLVDRKNRRRVAIHSKASGVAVEDRTDHLGNVYKSISDMCKHYNMSKDAYRKRLKFGYSKEYALTTPVRSIGNYAETVIHKQKPIINKESERQIFYRRAKAGSEVYDHKGNAFVSIHELCDFYKISTSRFYRMKANGWALEDILEQSLDHRGNKFNSIEDMCKHYGVTTKIYLKRRSRGKTKEQALTEK